MSLSTLRYGARNILRIGGWFAGGLLVGATAGVVLIWGWITLEWLLTADSGAPPTDAWVRYIYIIWGMIFGSCGAALGGVTGFVVGAIKMVRRELRIGDAARQTA